MTENGSEAPTALEKQIIRQIEVQYSAAGDHSFETVFLIKSIPKIV